MKHSIIQHTISTTTLMEITIATATATATATITIIVIDRVTITCLSFHPPTIVYVKDFSFMYHLCDAMKFFFTAIHCHLI